MYCECHQTDTSEEHAEDVGCNWRDKFAELILEDVDILHEIKSDRIFCSRQSIVYFIEKNFIPKQDGMLKSEVKTLFKIMLPDSPELLNKMLKSIDEHVIS